MSRNTLTVIFAISLVALIAVGAAFLILIEPSSVGDVGTVERSLSDAALPTTSTSIAEPSDSPNSTTQDADGPSPSAPIHSGGLVDVSTAEPVIPVALRLDSIDVDAPIVATGVNQRTGQMAVPANVRDVAWYEFGARPGQEGSAVLAAHVDLAGRGPGVFFHLRAVQPGDLVEVEFSDGSASLFLVEARTVYRKDELPLDTIFATKGSPVLTLITCGGGFSESTGSYDSNVVVYAVPVPDRDPGSAR